MSLDANVAWALSPIKVRQAIQMSNEKQRNTGPQSPFLSSTQGKLETYQKGGFGNRPKGFLCHQNFFRLP